jgi:hypothetical protein
MATLNKNRKIITINPTIFESIRILGEYEKEVGGGINLDDKKRVKNIVYFPSNSDSRLESDGKRYDIQFHTHPIKKNASPCEIILARIPSDNDIAYTFLTKVEELVITKGYAFAITIEDDDLFEKVRKRVRYEVKKEGKRFNIPYDYYYHYFKQLFNAIRKDAYANTRDDEIACKMIAKTWTKELPKYGIEIQRINFKHVEMKG